MADHEPAPWHQRPVPEAVAASVSGVSWAVAGGRWDSLPAHIAALVAPPIVVTALPPRPAPPIVVTARPPRAVPPSAAAGRAPMLPPEPLPRGRHRSAAPGRSGSRPVQPVDGAAGCAPSHPSPTVGSPA